MKNALYFCLAFLVLFLLSTCVTTVPPAGTAAEESATVTAYVGTYTRNEGWVNGQAAGVYEIDVLAQSGRITGQRLIKKVINPSFVVESADERYLYVVSELAGEDEPTGFLYVLDVADNFREVSKLPTDGKAPCHIEVSHDGQYVITANYVGGVSKLYRRQQDGSLVATDKFQVPATALAGRSSHLHSAQVAPDNETVAIADLGLDRIWRFKLDKTAGKLVPHSQPFVSLEPGAGPRHLQWSADGKFLYVINELNSTLSVLELAETSGELLVVQTVSTLPAGWRGDNSCADLHLHPSGKFLYGSNRGHNSIVAFGIAEGAGTVTLIGHTPTEGDTPRNFALAPSGRFLYVANQNSSNITAFGLDETNGTLTSLGQSFALGTPVCLEF